MAVPKRDIAAAVLAIAEALEAQPRVPIVLKVPRHLWVLDNRFAAFDAGIGRWLQKVEAERE